jgi:hypothetical protein
MRTVVGWLLLGLGVVLAVGGVIVAVIFGSDDTVTTGPHRLTTTGSAIVAAPSAIPWSGPTLLVTVSSPQNRARLFVGVAPDREVRNYLARTPYTRIDSVSLPWTLQAAHVLAEVTTRRGSVANPRQQSWWLSRTISLPSADKLTAAVPLLGRPIDVILMDLHHLHGFTAEVTVGIEQPGVFLGAIAAAVGGLGLAVAGQLVRRIPAGV